MSFCYWWKGGVGRNIVPLAHILEPIVLLIVWWKGGVERNSVTGANSFVASIVEGQGGEKRCFSRGPLEPILFLYGDRERWDRTVFIPPALVQ
jgi:hypothetical protein